MSSDVSKKFVSQFSLKESYDGSNADLSASCNRNENSRWTVTGNEKISCSLYKPEHSSTDLQPCFQMSLGSLYLLLVLIIHRVVGIQISNVCCNKNEKSRWTVTRNKKPCSLYKIEHSSPDLQPHLQMSSTNLCNGLVFRSHSVVEIQI